MRGEKKKERLEMVNGDSRERERERGGEREGLEVVEGWGMEMDRLYEGRNEIVNEEGEVIVLMMSSWGGGRGLVSRRN